MSSGFFASLKDRGAVIISGPDRRLFLQGLITNDVDLLDHQKIIYSCLLTPQGKFLHDFFMTEENDVIQLECEGGERAKDLANRLKPFRLRSKIAIQPVEQINVFISLTNKISDCQDPRHPTLGQRLYKRPDNLMEESFEHWDQHRIGLTVPDGSRDMEIGKSTLEEGHIDRLNGVSYTKGCYMGQELTARVHYRGLAKKHLCAIRTADPVQHPLPAPGSVLIAGGMGIGDMRSSCGGIGLALIRDDQIDRLNESIYSLIEPEHRP